jgi:hypothetical protein
MKRQDPIPDDFYRQELSPLPFVQELPNPEGWQLWDIATLVRDGLTMGQAAKRAMSEGFAHG